LSLKPNSKMFRVLIRNRWLTAKAYVANLAILSLLDKNLISFKKIKFISANRHFLDIMCSQKFLFRLFDATKQK
jgi:hypothetical protein